MLNKTDGNFSELNRTLLADADSQYRFDMHCQLLAAHSYVRYFSIVEGQLSIYRHSVVPISQNEQIISINPHLGGPLRYFRQAAGAGCHIHAFEERIHQYANLCRNLVHWQLDEHVTPICAGIWSGTGLQTVNHDGHSGTFYLPESVAVKLCDRKEVNNAHQSYRLDDYLTTQHFKPTLIECGRPGLAKHIVLGAEQTIKMLKPKLILVDAPCCDWLSLVKQWVPEYKVYYTEAGRKKAGAFLLTI